jgi:hypothetical protein
LKGLKERKEISEPIEITTHRLEIITEEEMEILITVTIIFLSVVK